MADSSQPRFESSNLDTAAPDLSESPFQIRCRPNTDLWDKPPSTHSFNAPRVYQKSKLSNFKSAQVTLSAAWKHQYDQGGLCLVIHTPTGSKHWIKTGIEFYEGQPYVATVVTDRWSDWSLTPNPSGTGKATLRMERVGNGTLWVYLVDGSDLKPLREVTFVLDVDGQSECEIGVYAAKPAPAGEKGDLVVNFEAFGLSI